MKVGKKTPLTLKHFEEFDALLATRADSENSWTVDLTARKAKAASDAQPLKERARVKAAEAEAERERLSTLKRAKPRDGAAIAEAEASISSLLKESRGAIAKAEAVENAVYDLKAVNPNRKADVDTRTPTELLDVIEAKGVEVAQALTALRALVNSTGIAPSLATLSDERNESVTR